VLRLAALRARYLALALRRLEGAFRGRKKAVRLAHWLVDLLARLPRLYRLALEMRCSG
jgi:hypothetical protein